MYRGSQIDVAHACYQGSNMNHAGVKLPEGFRLRYGGAFAAASCLSPPSTHQATHISGFIQSRCLERSV